MPRLLDLAPKGKRVITDLASRSFRKETETQTSNLLMLADSALQLQLGNTLHCSEANSQDDHEGQYRNQIPLEILQGITNVEAEENVPGIQQKLRLTQIRRLARLKNSKLMQKKRDVSKGCRRSKRVASMPSIPEEQVQQTTDEPAGMTELESVAQELTLPRGDRSKERAELLGITPAEQVSLSLEEQEVRPLPLTGLELIPASEIQMEAHRQHMLRIYKIQKQRAIEEMKKMYEAKRTLQLHAMNVQKIHASNRNLLHCLSQLPQQQHYTGAIQGQSLPTEKPPAVQNVETHLDMQAPAKEKPTKSASKSRTKQK